MYTRYRAAVSKIPVAIDAVGDVGLGQHGVVSSSNSIPARLWVEQEMVVVLLLLCVPQQGLVGVTVVVFHSGHKLEH